MTTQRPKHGLSERAIRRECQIMYRISRFGEVWITKKVVPHEPETKT